ncbi:helix-turn-helix transcriptional regulator [Thioclava atlantica]|uniref:Transcriptional regulator n=1 Tax=Thioclava atlantica TaxID=1317124 RepID=A0A085TSC4_9RHOB|nr:helix-turn-helix transcriptional regulator [Thioclava atlantica]KFE33621.1 transcriptional regulator [Thioclava atlantica]
MKDLSEDVPLSSKARLAMGVEPAARPVRARLSRTFFLYAALVVQSLSAAFFVGDLWSEVLGLRTWLLPWALQEYIQVLASVGLIVGVITSALFVRHSRKRIAAMGRQIDVVQGNFQSHMEDLFDAWGLSSSERAVAVYAMKGFSNREIAELRGKSESTVKTQLNAVFRKSGLNTRQQLTAFLVEELMSGAAVEPALE